MTPPGVEHTSAGHERQESKDTQATLGVDATPNDNCRTRKRAASDGSDDVDDAHEAKRFRVTAETPAGPTAAATTAQMTGLPTAAAPRNVSEFTTVAHAAVDNHDADTDEPDEVQDDDDDVEEEEIADAAPAQGRCRCTTTASYDDDVVPPTCVWTTLEPAAIAYGIIPNYVDDNQTPWRLTVIPLPRGARRTEQRVNPWLPSCQWVRLGPAHLRYERDPDWVDDDGGAWCLLLIPPPRRFAPPTAAGEDEASDDEWPEQVPFIAPQAGQEEECDCCCETSSSEPSDADEEGLAEELAEDDDEWFAEDDDESDDDEPMPPMPIVDQDAEDAEADLLMEKMKARVQNAIDDGEGSKWNNGHRLELVEGYLADDEITDDEDGKDADAVEEDDGADGEDECEDDDLEYVDEDELEYEEGGALEYEEEDELEYVDDEELEYAG